MTYHCDHNWARDDQYTKQCVKCGKYAPIQNIEIEEKEAEDKYQ